MLKFDCVVIQLLDVKICFNMIYNCLCITQNCTSHFLSNQCYILLYVDIAVSTCYWNKHMKSVASFHCVIVALVPDTFKCMIFCYKFWNVYVYNITYFFKKVYVCLSCGASQLFWGQLLLALCSSLFQQVNCTTLSVFNRVNSTTLYQYDGTTSTFCYAQRTRASHFQKGDT